MWNKIETFFLEPTSPLPLATLRIGLSLILLVQAYFLAPELMELYGSNGLLQGNLNAWIGGSDLPGISFWVHHLDALPEAHVVTAMGGLYLGAVLFLLFGFQTRVAATLTWALHLTFAEGHVTSYGVDTFVTIVLFYLIWMPSADCLSLDSLAHGSRGPSPKARLFLRLLQIHLCIAYLSSGLEKASGIQWWNGEAIWRALMLPEYAQVDMSWLAHVPWLPRALGWGTLIVECGYAIAVWFKKIRPYWVAATVSLHLGIALMMGLHLFSATMALLNLSAFGCSQESFLRWFKKGFWNERSTPHSVLRRRMRSL